MAEVTGADPALMMQALRDAGATCATGVVPQRLQSCQPQYLCSLKGVELCVQAAGAPVPAPVVGGPPAMFSGVGLVLIGVAVGWMLRRPTGPRGAATD